MFWSSLGLFFLQVLPVFADLGYSYHYKKKKKKRLHCSGPYMAGGGSQDDGTEPRAYSSSCQQPLLIQQSGMDGSY